MPKAAFDENRIRRVISQHRPAEGQTLVWHPSHTGFGVRITPTAVSFVHQYRGPAGAKRVTLGSWPATSYADAKRKYETRAGEQPAERLEARSLRRMTQQWMDYRTKYGNPTAKQRSQRPWSAKYAANVALLMDAYIWPVLGAKHIEDITRSDVTRISDNLLARGKQAQAQLVLAYLSSFYGWARARGHTSHNPAFGRLEVTGGRMERDRVLVDDELAALWAAAGKLELKAAGQLLRFLMLTGLRHREAARMTWNELDLDAGMLTIPAKRMKGRVEHVVMLPQPATDIINGLDRFEGCPWVFTFKGDACLDIESRTKKVITRLARVTNWRVHDFRRSMATWMQAEKIPHPVIDACLAHSQASSMNQVTATYLRHSYQREAGEALARWADHVVSVAG